MEEVEVVGGKELGCLYILCLLVWPAGPLRQKTAGLAGHAALHCSARCSKISHSQHVSCSSLPGRGHQSNSTDALLSGIQSLENKSGLSDQPLGRVGWVPCSGTGRLQTFISGLQLLAGWEPRDWGPAFEMKIRAFVGLLDVREGPGILRYV